jgi:lipopolysaccharide/colanic/teichoic acid biosynthesis glycosyltransferase
VLDKSFIRFSPSALTGSSSKTGVFMPSEVQGSPEHAEAVRLRLSQTPWGVSFKHLADFVIALCLLLLTWPLMVLAALLVKLTSPGPMVYSQTRLGCRGRLYRIYKIRTMYHNCETLSGPCWSTPGDARITPIGRFLRRTHLDELPQLWNVLRREMSLVGPRPERPEFAVHLEELIPSYRERLIIRPGITGLAQVQLPGDTDLESVRRKLCYDLYYVDNMNPLLDLKIIGSTIFKMLGFSYLTLRQWFRLPEPGTIVGTPAPSPQEAGPRPNPSEPAPIPIQVSLPPCPVPPSVHIPTTVINPWSGLPIATGRSL